MSKYDIILSWFPGIIFPISIILNIIKVFKSRNVSGFNPITYIIFVIADLLGFILEKIPFKLNNIFGFLVPFILNVILLSIYFWKTNINKLIIFLLITGIIFITVFYQLEDNKKEIKKYKKEIDYGLNLLLPIAAFLQLFKILYKKSAKGISRESWLLSLIGSIGLFFLEGRFNDPLAYLGTFGSAFIKFLIIYYTYVY